LCSIPTIFIPPMLWPMLPVIFPDRWGKRSVLEHARHFFWCAA
jgi:hypothetical protein